jgi:hypothetical protein
MPEQRRRFSPQFKAEAVHMVIETGRPIAAVARDRSIAAHARNVALGGRILLSVPNTPSVLLPVGRRLRGSRHEGICRRRMRW